MSQGHLIFTPCIFFELPTWKSEEKRTFCVVVALSRQGTGSFQSPLLKQKILWAKLLTQTSLFVEDKKDHKFFMCVPWLLMENITKS